MLKRSRLFDKTFDRVNQAKRYYGCIKDIVHCAVYPSVIWSSLKRTVVYVLSYQLQ